MEGMITFFFSVQLVIENVHLVTQNTVLYAVSGVPEIHVR
jgi:hypothetical protein